jgi:hypothetical protein
MTLEFIITFKHGLLVLENHKYYFRIFDKKMDLNKIVIAACFLIVSSCSTSSPRRTSDTSKAPVDMNWTFETTPHWSDEFNYHGLPDSSKWG